MTFRAHTDLLHRQDHLGTDVLLRIHRRHREITLFVSGLVSEVRVLALSGVPLTLDGIDVVVAVVIRAVEPDIVKDKEFGFRTEPGHIADPCELKVFFSLLSDVSGIARIFFLCHGIDYIADHRKGWDGCKRLHHRRDRVRNNQHVTGVYRLPSPDAGSIETVA